MAKRSFLTYLLFALLIFIAFCIVYNLPFFQEIRDYREIKREPCLSLCELYEQTYPSGRHLEDVLYIEVSLDESDVHLMNRYLQKYPDGKYFDKVLTLCDRLWSLELENYKQRDHSKDSPEAVRFMSSLFQYLQGKHIDRVKLEINPEVTLKDYDEYSEVERTFAELFGTSSLSIEGHMLSLRDNFTASDKSFLTDILKDGLQKSLDRVFSSGFINVDNNDETINEELCCDVPTFTIDYHVKNQEVETGEYHIPDIWIYSQNNVPTDYLLGITIDFNLHCIVPDSDVEYSFSESGEPANDINGIDDIRDGYRRMTSMCFAKFSNKLSTNLGLAEVYFQGDDE